MDGMDHCLPDINNESHPSVSLCHVFLAQLKVFSCAIPIDMLYMYML